MTRASMDSVEARIRRRLRDGVLPRLDAAETWAGTHGTESICSGCEEPVRYGEVEYELLFEDGGRETFHLSCMRMWEKLKTVA